MYLVDTPVGWADVAIDETALAVRVQRELEAGGAADTGGAAA